MTLRLDPPTTVPSRCWRLLERFFGSVINDIELRVIRLHPDEQGGSDARGDGPNIHPSVRFCTGKGERVWPHM
jgi:hypothetical protein